MYRIKTLNNISPSVLEVLKKDEYELSDTMENPDALFVRASDLHGYDFNENALVVPALGSIRFHYRNVQKKGLSYSIHLAEMPMR